MLAPWRTVVAPAVQSVSDFSDPSLLIARGKRSFVKTACGPTNTPSSSVTPWKIDARFSILQRSPMTTPASTYTPLPRMHSRPIRARSRTCASCQIAVPSPIAASGETSASGARALRSCPLPSSDVHLPPSTRERATFYPATHASSAATIFSAACPSPKTGGGAVAGRPRRAAATYTLGVRPGEHVPAVRPASPSTRSRRAASRRARPADRPPSAGRRSRSARRARAARARAYRGSRPDR